MNTIKNQKIISLEKDKSKFIGLIFHIEEKNQVKTILNQVKSEYQNAKHYVYGYKINDIYYSTDDGEPSGTFKNPCLNNFNEKKLNFCLIIIVRYFGGVLLGSSNLLRAYNNIIKSLLYNNLVTCLIGRRISLEATYNLEKKLDQTFKDFIIKKEYLDKILYYLDIPNEYINQISNYKYEVLKDNIVIYNQ